MIVSPPEYFIRISKEASRRWDQLESDPVLAGPWHQLFRQVQSPRHVLSELLQNADDAGATWVRASLKDGVFEFAHNGNDFDEVTFQSLCQFGLSNKRHLHTIGFRGVGFRSVFAFGPRVEARTPTITFAFEKKRFTEPRWINVPATEGETIFRVQLDGPSKSAVLETEFKRWLKSPIPLLFFQSIVSLEIQGRVVHKEIVGPGPVSFSERIRLLNEQESELLCFRSAPEQFPRECLEEIREERGSQELDLPPCAVQIILGTPDPRLYTVLPTDVQPLMPFSLNAPFVQDPARKEIKHPASSPTNAWLLERIGQLAGEAILGWLRNDRMSLGERARAYELLPKSVESDGSLNKETSLIILKGLRRAITSGQKVLLCHDGTLAEKGEAIDLPAAVHDTWGTEKVLQVFGQGKKKAIAREIPARFIETLETWALVQRLGVTDIARRLILMNPGPPCPEPLENLIFLWNFLQPLWNNWNFWNELQSLKIVPASQRSDLMPSGKLIAVGGKESRISEDDWSFLMSWADIVNPKWVKLMTGTPLDSDHALASDLFNKLKLHERVGIEQVVKFVAERIFTQNPGEAAIRLAHVAARGGVRVPDSFKFLCRDGRWRACSEHLIVENSEDLSQILPESLFDSLVVSDAYESGLDQEYLGAWRDWASDVTKSKLSCFPMPVLTRTELYGKEKLSNICVKRGGCAPSSYPIQSRWFELRDYDWKEALWEHWNQKAEDDPSFWKSIGISVVRGWSEKWEETLDASIKQLGHTKAHSLGHGDLEVGWLLRLKSLPCLPDTFGRPAIPAELLRTTSETMALMNIERFVHPDLDHPEYSKVLDLLGVRCQPSGFGTLLDRIRAISRSAVVPVTPVIDLFRALDRATLRISHEELTELRHIFSEEALVFSDGCTWEKLSFIFQSNPENIPGISTIHGELKDLSLWQRLDMAAQPTLETALQWLNEKKSNEVLNSSDREKVVQIVQRAPAIVWQKCGAWLNLSGRWISKEDLRWGAVGHLSGLSLFESFRKKTADLTMLGDVAHDLCREMGLEALDQALEMRLVKAAVTGYTPKPPWIETLGGILSRLRCPDIGSDANTQKCTYDEDRKAAARLSRIGWQSVSELKLAPYMDGQPAGPEKSCKALWHDDTIYAQGSSPFHHRDLVIEISRFFRTVVAKRAVQDCTDREPAWIIAYANEHLELDEEMERAPEPHDKIDDVIRLRTDMEEVQTSEVSFVSTGEEIQTQHSSMVPPPGTAADSPAIEEVDPAQSGVEPEPIAGHGDRKQRQEHLRDVFHNWIENQGFKYQDVTKSFISPDLQIIRRAEPPFQWIRYDREGSELVRYWLGRGSLKKGVELPSEIWNWPLREGLQVLLVIWDSAEQLETYSLAELKRGAEQGLVSLYTAKLMVRA
ncbi:MAG TPA: hypothetical protein PLM79_15940, partial [Syntrophobacteraceae bacterium]|nr:hypothetical protein [Syntrophobacteraceae bacterium]